MLLIIKYVLKVQQFPSCFNPFLDVFAAFVKNHVLNFKYRIGIL